MLPALVMNLVPWGVAMTTSWLSYWKMPYFSVPSGLTWVSTPVPRIPMVASGVCILTPSGLCLAISPVTVRKVPWARLRSMLAPDLAAGSKT